MLFNEFRECEACAKQPGSPPLCGSCFNNRSAISDLNEKCKRLMTAAQKMIDAVASGEGVFRAAIDLASAMTWQPEEPHR